MNEMIFNAIDDVVLESEFDTAYALAQGYLKAIAILESDDVTGEAEGFAIFQESGDEKDKKSKEEKKDAAKGGLINAIKRMFAAIAAKFKKSEENDPEKLDEKKKSKLKKFGIAAGVATATAGAVLIAKKAANNRTDAEIQDELRKMASSSLKNADKVHNALSTIEIKNGGKVYFRAMPVKPVETILKKIAKFLKKPGSVEEAQKIVDEAKALCEYNKDAVGEQELGEFAGHFSACILVIEKDLNPIVSAAPDPNSSDATIKVLGALNLVESKAISRARAVLHSVDNAIYNLHYIDEVSGEYVGLKRTDDGLKVDTAENVDKKMRREAVKA